MLMLFGVMLAAVPIALIVALFGVANWLEGRRRDAVARQIRVTDALHARVGAVVAPVVRKPLRHPWQVLVSVPLERQDVLDALFAAAREEFTERSQRQEPFEIVVTPRTSSESRRLRTTTAGGRRAESLSWT